MAVLAGILGGLINALGNFLGNEVQHEHQLEYMDKSQEQAIERFNMENEYNSPINVRNRLEAAGLNPNLMYAQSGNTPASMSAQSAPQAYVTSPSSGLGSVLSALSQQQLVDSQVAVNESVARRNNSQSSNLDANTDVIYKRLSLDERKFAEQLERDFHLNELDDAKRDEARSHIAVNVQAANELVSRIALNDSKTAHEQADALLTNLKSDTWKDEVSSRLRQEGLMSDKLEEELTDLIATRAYRIEAIMVSNRSESEKIQLIQHQIQLMSGDIASSNATARVYNNKGIGTALTLLDIGTSCLGRLLRFSIGNYKSTSTKE